jgi:hypothetical protein
VKRRKGRSDFILEIFLERAAQLTRDDGRGIHEEAGLGARKTGRLNGRRIDFSSLKD